MTRVADIFVVELDYSVGPTIAVIGRDERGRLRKACGYTGWIVYRVASRRLAKLLNKMLALANRLGIGRSRAIGLGTVKAEWTPLKNPIPKQAQNRTPTNT